MTLLHGSEYASRHDVRDAFLLHLRVDVVSLRALMSSVSASHGCLAKCIVRVALLILDIAPACWIS
jgi:hypothetical protein